MTNSKKLVAKMFDLDVSKKVMAQTLGISVQALYNKLNNVSEFKSTEISAITEKLKLTDEERNDIFFAKKEIKNLQQ